MSAATLTQMQARLRAIRAWLLVLTTLQVAQIGGLIAILIRQ